MTKVNKIRSVSIDPLSYCSLPIRLTNIDTNTTLASATGFLFRNANTYYLITNWHNLTGVDPGTKKRIDDQFSASPTGIVIPLLEQTTPFIKWKRVIVPLYNSENKPQWFLHPLHHENVDVVALEIGDNDGVLPLKAINECDFEDIKPQVADDVYLLGFPHNLKAGGNFPLWKRGSMATEPDIDLDKLPKMLVDTASRPGMSGSPVIHRRQGLHGLVDGTLTGQSLIGEIQNLCGIYSGRVNTNTELDTQLGIVWKAEVIQEIIDGKYQENTYYPETSFA